MGVKAIVGVPMPAKYAILNSEYNLNCSFASGMRLDRNLMPHQGLHHIRMSHPEGDGRWGAETNRAKR